MQEVMQLAPNHADHISCYNEKYLHEMFKTEPVIAQPKYDGERMLVHFDGPNVYCTSRRFSKKTGRYMENQCRLPKLQSAWQQRWNSLPEEKRIGYTVIDCECYAKTWSEAASVLHSLPERAAELQNTIHIKYACFDCLIFDGVDIRERSYRERLHQLMLFIRDYRVDALHFAQFMNDEHKPDGYMHSTLIQSDDDWKECMQNAIAAGFEGIVCKSLFKAYYDKGASLKCKKFETVDVVVYSYNQGTGKYANTVGALLVGYYDPAKNDIVHISRVNCGTDAERNMWRDQWAELKGSVIEVKCQEITNRSLRHPVYVRLRKDKNPYDCTRETIFKEDTADESGNEG